MRLVRERAAGCGLPGLDARTAYLGHGPPSVTQVLGALAGTTPATRRAVVLPLLLTAAYHSETDLPALIADASRARPGMDIGYGRPLGPHPLLLRALDRRLAESGGPAGPPDEVAVVLAAAGIRGPPRTPPSPGWRRNGRRPAAGAGSFLPMRQRPRPHPAKR